MSAKVPTITIDAADGYELVELLQLINDWLRIDHRRARTSLDDLVGYDLAALRDDLSRFSFLLGGPADHYLDGDQP
jgi:hypothetical protein